jgi:hypothetical protein
MLKFIKYNVVMTVNDLTGLIFKGSVVLLFYMCAKFGLLHSGRILG